MIGSAASLYANAGLAVEYAAVAAPMVAGMVRNGAPLRQLLAAPLYAVPATIATGLGLSIAGSLGASLGISLGEGALSLAAGTAASAALGYLSGRMLAKPRDSSSEHRRGTVIHEPERAANDLPDRQGGRGLNRGITIAGVLVPERDETKHFKIIGTTGTGKSTAITEILQAALARGDRAVIADPDGGYMRRFFSAERGDVILNPFETSSRKWDLFGEIQTPYDVEQLARSLIPDHEGSDRSWRGYARTFFTAVTRRAHEAGVDDVGELHRLLAFARPPELRELLAGTAAQPFLEQDNSRMFDSIRSVTSSAVTALEYVGQQGQEKLSVRNWTRGAGEKDGCGGGVLFIPYQAGQIAALRSQISAWMRLSMFEAMNQPGKDQRLWFGIDELDAVGQIDGLKDALARLRKFGGRCILGFQSIAQVSSTYGQGEAHTIVENCSNSLILRSSASEGGGTARFASGLIGDREVLRTMQSRSRRPLDVIAAKTSSQQVSLEAAILPSQIEQLPDLTGYLKIASRPEWLRVHLTPSYESGAARERASNDHKPEERARGGYEL